LSESPKGKEGSLSVFLFFAKKGQKGVRQLLLCALSLRGELLILPTLGGEEKGKRGNALQGFLQGEFLC